jgi:hypothetical protein
MGTLRELFSILDGIDENTKTSDKSGPSDPDVKVYAQFSKHTFRTVKLISSHRDGSRHRPNKGMPSVVLVIKFLMALVATSGGAANVSANAGKKDETRKNLSNHRFLLLVLRWVTPDLVLRRHKR